MNLLVKIAPLLLLFMSCKKKDDPKGNQVFLEKGVLVLSEGLFQQNNASLTYYDDKYDVLHQSFYLNNNDEMLGDVANDMLRYGGKIYIVLNNSNLITVLDAYSGVVLKKIPMTDSGTGRSPRNIVGYENKIYVCSFDGTIIKMDTSTLYPENIIQIGRNPDGMAISNGKLYVSNSGGLDFPNYDMTVSVIDLQSFQELNRITVGKNPGSIVSDFEGDIYLIKRGDYGSDSTRLLRIDPLSGVVVQEFSGLNITQIFSTGMGIYFVHTDAYGNHPKLGVIDTDTEMVTDSNWFDISHVQTLYAIHVDEPNSSIYLMDAHNYSSSGTIYVHSFSGSLIRQINTGYLPKKVVIFE
ncbi:MAG: hypothetical protein R2799_04050 [Crocinitomicaceae bacterium]